MTTFSTQRGPGEDSFVLGLLLANQTDAHHHAAEVSQVEHVVRLGRGRQQVAHRHLVHFQRAAHHHVASSEEVRWKVITLRHTTSLINRHRLEQEPLLRDRGPNGQDPEIRVGPTAGWVFTARRYA